ncbi:MAG TPA: c-type cytochrome [Gallionellaceae bacterium]
MKSILISIMAALGLAASTFALAVEMPAVGKEKCAACHDVKVKKVGPAFMDVSKKYKGDKDAVQKISASIKSGGKFGWNLGQMPARGLGSRATDADVDTMAKFIAGLAKGKK